MNDTFEFRKEVVSISGKEFEIISPDHAALYERRAEFGLSQQQVADRAGILLRQYQRFESGDRSMASASLRIGLAICDVLELDPHRFVPRLPARPSK